MNRAAYLPLMLTGNIGQAGRRLPHLGRQLQGGALPGLAVDRARASRAGSRKTRSSSTSIRKRPASEIHAHAYTKDEEPAYWNHGDKPLIVNTPKDGRKNFTGQAATCRRRPRRSVFTNVNLINNAKWAYDMIKNVNPKIEMIVSIDIADDGVD